MSSLPLSPTRRFHEKREAILNAAAQQFNLQGVKGTTLADIAASVGLVTNSVTYYYRKKEDLAAECFLRSIAALDQLADAASHHTSLQERVHELFRQLATLMAAMAHGEHPPLVLFTDMRTLPAPQLATIHAANTQLFRKMRQLLQTPQTKHLTRTDLNARAYGTLSLAMWLRSWVPRYSTEDYADICQRASDLLLHGSGASTSAWLPPSAAEQAWQLHPVSDATREDFLQAASRLMNVQGYRGVSVDKIAARLNVTKGSFYHHNDNKEDLAWACFERSFAIASRTLNLANRDFGNGWERLCAATRALARFQLSPQGPLLRMAAITAIDDPLRKAQALTTMDRLGLRQTGILVDGMMDGSVRPLDPNVAALIGTGIVSSASVLQQWFGAITPDNVGEVYVRPMVSGLLCPSAGVA